MMVTGARRRGRTRALIACRSKWLAEASRLSRRGGPHGVGATAARAIRAFEHTPSVKRHLRGDNDHGDCRGSRRGGAQITHAAARRARESTELDQHARRREPVRQHAGEERNHGDAAPYGAGRRPQARPEPTSGGAMYGGGQRRCRGCADRRQVADSWIGHTRAAPSASAG